MKYKFLLTLIAFVASFGAMNATEIAPYKWELQMFSPYYPADWTHIKGEADFSGVKKSIDYSRATQQEVEGSYITALCAPSQNILKDETDPSVYQTVNDYLISPAIKGELSMYVSRYFIVNEDAHKVPSIKLFPATKNADGTFTVDINNEIQTNFNEISDLIKDDATYHKLHVNLGEEYKNIAFRFDYVNVADLCAESALLGDNRKVELKYVMLSSGFSSPFSADSEGKVTIKCDFNITNKGNVRLARMMRNIMACSPFSTAMGLYARLPLKGSCLLLNQERPEPLRLNSY